MKIEFPDMEITRRPPIWPVLMGAMCVVLLMLGFRYVMKLPPFEPEDIKLHMIAGNDYLNTGLFVLAEKEFQQVIDIRPNHKDAVTGKRITRIYRSLSKGDYQVEEIHSRLKQILNRKPDSAHAHVLLGDLFAKTDSGKAADHYQKALYFEPSAAEAYYGLGILHNKEGNIAKSLEMFQKAAALAPSNPRYLIRTD